MKIIIPFDYATEKLGTPNNVLDQFSPESRQVLVGNYAFWSWHLAPKK